MEVGGIVNNGTRKIDGDSSEGYSRNRFDGFVNREGEMQSDEQEWRKLRLEARQGMEATP